MYPDGIYQVVDDEIIYLAYPEKNDSNVPRYQKYIYMPKFQAWPIEINKVRKYEDSRR